MPKTTKNGAMKPYGARLPALTPGALGGRLTAEGRSSSAVTS